MNSSENLITTGTQVTWNSFGSTYTGIVETVFNLSGGAIHRNFHIRITEAADPKDIGMLAPASEWALKAFGATWN